MNSFDEELHVYRADTGRLPGATDIIKSEGLIATEWMSEECRWRGKVAHYGIKLMNKGTLDWKSVDAQIVGYLYSYKKFLSMTGFRIVGSEEPLFTPSFGTIPDLWGYLNEIPAIIELKTGPVAKWAAIQTALQKKALEEHGFFAEKRFGLRLMANGDLSRLVPFEDPDDEFAALSMVHSFHWKMNHGYFKWDKEER